MPRVMGLLTIGAAALYGLSVPASSAQEKPAADRGEAVFRMTILNGGSTTVRYFADKLSESDRAILRDVEVLENEASLARELQDLKLQYVLSEQILEPRRRAVQQALYGIDITTTDYAYGGWGYWPGVTGSSVWGNYAWNGTAWSGGYGWGGGVTVHQGLGTGVGPEGAVKEALARTLAMQPSSDYPQGRSRVAERVAASPTLRGLADKGHIGVVGYGDRGRGGVTLMLKSGERLHGTKYEEKGDWVTLHGEGGRRSRVRLSEVVRIDEVPTK